VVFYYVHPFGKKHMNKMLDAVEATVSKTPNTTTHAIANKLRIAESTTANYLQKLVKSGRIQATGNGHKRRYSKKLN
jgi:predicted HTH transcriptional regulator